jgi:protein-S-isoprenylcysteine O-methyltransferase Ste14
MKEEDVLRDAHVGSLVCSLLDEDDDEVEEALQRIDGAEIAIGVEQLRTLAKGLFKVVDRYAQPFATQAIFTKASPQLVTIAQDAVAALQKVQEVSKEPLPFEQQNLEQLLIMGHATLADPGLGRIFTADLVELLLCWMFKCHKAEKRSYFDWDEAHRPQIARWGLESLAAGFRSRQLFEDRSSASFRLEPAVKEWHALDFIVAAFPLADDREDVRSRLALLLFLQVQQQPLREWRRIGPDLVKGLLDALRPLLPGDPRSAVDAWENLGGIIEALTSLHILLEVLQSEDEPSPVRPVCIYSVGQRADIWRPVMQYLTNMLQDANAEYRSAVLHALVLTVEVAMQHPTSTTIIDEHSVEVSAALIDLSVSESLNIDDSINVALLIGLLAMRSPRHFGVVLAKASKLDRGVNSLMGRHRSNRLCIFILEAGYKVIMASRRTQTSTVKAPTSEKSMKRTSTVEKLLVWGFGSVDVGLDCFGASNTTELVLRSLGFVVAVIAMVVTFYFGMIEFDDISKRPRSQMGN